MSTSAVTDRWPQRASRSTIQGGVAAFVFGRPFLTSAHGHPAVGVLGELPLASAAVFDLGVYLTVVGATLLTLSVLGSASGEGRSDPGKTHGKAPGKAQAGDAAW